MFRHLPLTVALLALSSAAGADTSGFNPHSLYLGAGFSYNQIDSPFGGGSADATGVTVFAGYDLPSQIAQVRTRAELGYSQTSDFYTGADIKGLWLAGVLEKDMPEIHPRLFVLGRAGFDIGDDDGILMGVGAGMHLAPKLDVRGEFLNKDSTTVVQASLVLQF